MRIFYYKFIFFSELLVKITSLFSLIYFLIFCAISLFLMMVNIHNLINNIYLFIYLYLFVFSLIFIFCWIKLVNTKFYKEVENIQVKIIKKEIKEDFFIFSRIVAKIPEYYLLIDSNHRQYYEKVSLEIFNKYKPKQTYNVKVIKIIKETDDKILCLQENILW
jgi:hypothetical protein